MPPVMQGAVAGTVDTVTSYFKLCIKATYAALKNVPKLVKLPCVKLLRPPPMVLPISQTRGKKALALLTKWMPTI
jgi:hypothetical protein